MSKQKQNLPVLSEEDELMRSHRQSMELRSRQTNVTRRSLCFRCDVSELSYMSEWRWNNKLMGYEDEQSDGSWNIWRNEETEDAGVKHHNLILVELQHSLHNSFTGSCSNNIYSKSGWTPSGANVAETVRSAGPQSGSASGNPAAYSSSPSTTRKTTNTDTSYHRYKPNRKRRNSTPKNKLL